MRDEKARREFLAQKSEKCEKARRRELKKAKFKIQLKHIKNFKFILVGQLLLYLLKFQKKYR